MTKIDFAEVIPLEVPLNTTFYISRMPISKRCTLIIRMKTAGGVEGQIFIGDERNNYAAICDFIKEEIFPRIPGRRPSDVTAIWEEIFAMTVPQSYRRGIIIHALAAVDTALWDLIGRQAGMPVFRLLGAAQTRLQPTVISGYRIEGEDEPDAVRTIEVIEEVREAGYAGLKLKVGGFDPEVDINRVREIRKAVGDEFILICDANKGYSVEQAIDFAEGVSEFNIEWLEEPTPWYNEIESMRKIRESSPIPVAAGQGEYDRWGCRALVEGGAVDILNNDISKGGGVSEWIRIARFASCHGVKSAHHEDPEIAMHLLASTPLGLYPEYFREERDPIGAHLCVNAPRPKDGWISPPERPGFGLEFDEDYIKKYRVD